MKRKSTITNLIIFCFVLLTFFACKDDEEDNCEDWKYNEKWSKIVNSSSCSAEQKGEAYLALGGFDYFNLIRFQDSPFAEVLGLNSGNISTKQNYFDKAAETVESTYQNGSGIAKTIYLFGTFAGAYTYLTGNLDLGVDGSADGFDGIFSSYEINNFLGTDVSEDTNDLNNMVATTTYQIKSSDNYYLYNTVSTKLFNDDLADGIDDSPAVEIIDNSTDVPPTFEKTTILANTTAIYQVTELNSITDPLSGATSKNPSDITGFADNIAGYLQQIKSSLQVLDIEDTSTMIEDITTLQNQLDNGGKCDTFQVGSALNFLNMIVEKTRKDQLPSTSYATDNILSTADIISDSSSDSSDDIFTDITAGNPLFANVSEFGVKLKFKNNSGGFEAYWAGAHPSDIYTPMDNLSALTNNELTAGDGKIALTEILCAGELISK
jgi:hypothetical protein